MRARRTLLVLAASVLVCLACDDDDASDDDDLAQADTAADADAPELPGGDDTADLSADAPGDTADASGDSTDLSSDSGDASGDTVDPPPTGERWCEWRTPAPGEPELPRLRVDIAAPQQSGTVHAVAAGADLQAALDAARPGDVLELEAGASWVGNFVLPNTGDDGDQWIVVRSSAAALPPEGTRVTPDDAALLARLETPNALPVLRTADGAHHWRLEGLHLAAGAGVDVNDLVVFGSAEASSPEGLAHHLIIDRSLVTGDPTLGGKRGVQLNAAHVAVISSWVQDFMREGQDTQALLGWNGPGPFLVANNRLEAAGENIMFGGADSRSAAMNPADIAICANHLYKPLRWKQGAPEHDGSSWTVKNIFELKNASRVLFDANVLEHNWAAAQTGFAVVLKSVNQDGGAPWSVTQDVTFTRNVILDSDNGLNLSGRGDGNPTDAPSQRFLVEHNLLGTSGRLVQSLNDLDGLIIRHNTGFATNTFLSIDGAVAPSLVFVDNLVAHGEYGLHGSGQGVGTGSLDAFYESWTFAGNVIIGGNAGSYPPDNFFPATVEEVDFTDYPDDLSLAATSPYAGLGTDGSDPGADVARVLAAVANVR